MAYFTDVEEATNVFTAGNVDISLTYGGTEVNADVNDTTVSISTKIFPGKTYEIPAVITNAGTEDAYVGAIITLTGTGLSNVVAAGGEAEIPVAISNLITDLDANAKVVANGDTITVYVVNATALTGTNKFTAFSGIKIPKTWDHAQVNTFKAATITVKAYATQKEGFSDAQTALKTAFANNGWENYPTN